MAVGLKKMGKPSPLKILPWIAANPMAAMGVAQAGMGILGGLIGGKKRRREQRKARAAMEASRKRYEQQEYTNPYANLENPYEDLTVNQQQAQFEAQQQAQSRADILGGLRETAGGAGVAGLAQAMANQSALGAQRISASIGEQEAANQKLRAQGAMATQRLERYGEGIRQGKEEARISTLYGQDMGRLTAANQARQKARSQMISGIGAGLGTMVQGLGMGETPFGKVGGGTTFNQQNAIHPNMGQNPTYTMDPNQLGNRPNVTIDPHTGTEIDISQNENPYNPWG
tara:strand:- start:4773 stop:5630 length:858 start_codon:yes stop_codon:yes gene_type:complete